MNNLTDQYGRVIDYLRISITDRCDLRCRYCMPKGFSSYAEPENWLTFEELEQLIKQFAQLGIKHVRLTGGEPLLRRNLADLAKSISAIEGIEDLSLSTNGVRLAAYADELYKAGIRRINVSLDSLTPETYATVTNGGRLNKVLEGLCRAKEAGFSPVKINTVVMRGVNDKEIEKILEFCILNDYTLRLIETMPIGTTGRAALESYVSLDLIRQKLAACYRLVPDIMPGAGPARYYRIEGSDTRIGFITPISQHFCQLCNRVRLSVEGDIYACLGDEHLYPLRAFLRKGCSDEELRRHILKAIALKPERHEFQERPERVVRFMSMTGG